MALLNENNNYTYDEFLKITEGSKDKIEFHNGKIVNMSPTSINHNKITTNITFELKSFFKGSKCDVYSEQVAILFESETEKREFLPDVFVVCEDAKISGEKFITPPKLIFEVVSKKYASNDYFVKAEAYQNFGVLEYNIVEQNGHIVQYALEDGKYLIKNTYHLGDVYNSIVFNDLQFKLDDIF